MSKEYKDRWDKPLVNDCENVDPKEVKPLHIWDPLEGTDIKIGTDPVLFRPIEKTKEEPKEACTHKETEDYYGLWSFPQHKLCKACGEKV